MLLNKRQRLVHCFVLFIVVSSIVQSVLYHHLSAYEPVHNILDKLVFIVIWLNHSEMEM